VVTSSGRGVNVGSKKRELIFRSGKGKGRPRESGEKKEVADSSYVGKPP